MQKKSLTILLAAIATFAVAKISRAETQPRIIGFTGRTISALQAHAASPEEEQLHREQLEACDKAIDAQSVTIEAQERLIKEQDALMLVQKEEVDRLRARSDVWYRKDPWLLFVIGVAAGGLALSLVD